MRTTARMETEAVRKARAEERERCANALTKAVREARAEERERAAGLAEADCKKGYHQNCHGDGCAVAMVEGR